MDCKEIKVMLNALVDGEVNDSDREIIMSHIAECEDCKKEYEELLAIKDAFKKFDTPLDGKLAESTMKEIYKKAYPEKKKSFLFRHIGTVAALFVIAVFFIYNATSKSKDMAVEENKENQPIHTMKAEGEYAFAVNPESQADEKTEVADKVTDNIQTPAEALPEAESPLETAPEESTGTDDAKSESSVIEPSEKPAATPEEPKAEEPKAEAPIEEEPLPEDVYVEEPKAETPMEVTPGIASKDFFNKFRYSNSIELDTSIIFVKSDINTLLDIFDTAKTVADNGIKLEIQPVKVIDILFSNSITVTSSDFPENSVETIIYTE